MQGVSLSMAASIPMPNPGKGLGSAIFEVVSDFDTNTFRAAYAVRLERAVYFLHCFQKKSTRGVRTAKTDVDLIEHRLRAAKTEYEAQYGPVKQKR
jgi:phage-related protein